MYYLQCVEVQYEVKLSACVQAQASVPIITRVKFLILIVLKMCGCATIFISVFSWVSVIYRQLHIESHVGSLNLVCRPESRSIRLSEVIYVLVL